MTRPRPPQETSPQTGWIYALVHWREWLMVALAEWMVRRWRGLGLLMLAVVVGVWFQSPLVFLLVLFAPLWWKLVRAAFRLWWKGRQSSEEPGWWSHTTLQGALIQAGVLKAPPPPPPPTDKRGKPLTDKKGRPLPPRPTLMLSYRGQPVHTEYGTTVTVGLPQAKTLEDVAARRKSLASALNVPKKRLHLSDDDEDPANVISIHVSTRPTDGPVSPPVVTMERTNWADPIAFATDSRGRVITAKTDQRNSMLGGKPGYGKTSSGRVFIAHFLLDPTATVKIVDGKGAIDDYGSCVPMCETYIPASDKELVPKTLNMLGGVMAEIERRNAVGGRHPGILVVLEELQKVRTRCSKAQLETLDELTGNIIREGRAVGVVLLVIVQKPSAQDVPTGVRSQVAQGLAFFMRKADYSMVLNGDQPEVPLPRVPGEAIWSEDGEQELVTCYYLNDADWAAICQRAAKLRAIAVDAEVHHPRLLELVADTTEIPAVPPADADSLIDAVVTVLEDADPKGLTPATLHGLLPAWVQARYPTAVELGRALARYPQHVERRPRGSARVWRLTAAGGPDSSERVV